MMIKLKLIATLFFLTTLAVQAQDQIELKDGTILSGKITEYKSKEYIIFQTKKEALVTLSFDEIKQVQFNPSVGTIKGKGYFNNTSIGALIGGNRYSSIAGSFTLNTINGYMFNPHFQTGIGVGLEILQDKLYFPLFADVRYNFKKGSFSPFVGAQAGVAFQDFKKREDFPSCLPYEDCILPYPIYNELDGGLMASLQLGIKNYIKNDFGYTISIGYRMQQLRGYNFGTWDYFSITNQTDYLHRLDLKIGVIFN